MNFFETQEQSLKNTRKLVLAMSLAVVAVVVLPHDLFAVDVEHDCFDGGGA